MMGRLMAGLLCGAFIVAGGATAAAQTPPSTPPPAGTVQSAAPPAAEDHSAHMAQAAKQADPKEPIPPITDADRLAAFPQGLEGHRLHDRAINFMVLFDQLERRGFGDGGGHWDNRTWIGGDINRLWLRSDGEAIGGRVEHASVTALLGHSVSRWWDVVAGVRQDFRPGPAQTWAAVGIQGLAPLWFEVEATGYVGAGGQTRLHLEVEYELLVTNRLILQPLIEADLFGKSDPARGVGAGLSTLETGLRLRYEFRRELAPYVGLTWERAFAGTANAARAAGQDVKRARLAVGLRTWF